MRMLSSIFRRLVEWGLGGVVAGVVAGIIPVGCDGLPRVVSRWSGLSRGQRVLPSGSWRAGDEFRVSTGRGWSSAAGGSFGAPRRGWGRRPWRAAGRRPAGHRPGPRSGTRPGWPQTPARESGQARCPWRSGYGPLAAGPQPVAHLEIGELTHPRAGGEGGQPVAAHVLEAQLGALMGPLSAHG